MKPAERESGTNEESTLWGRPHGTRPIEKSHRFEIWGAYGGWKQLGAVTALDFVDLVVFFDLKVV